MKNQTPKLLLCDDSSENFLPMAAELSKMGFMICTRISDENTLIDTIRNEDPDIVVADLTASKADLFKLMYISKNVFNKKSEFIITSDIDNSFIKRQVINAGAAYFLPKPYTPQHISSIAKSIIRSNTDIFSDDVEVAVTSAIRNLAVPINMKGYHYIRLL